jgi:hypothetical protein
MRKNPKAAICSVSGINLKMNNNLYDVDIISLIPSPPVGERVRVRGK